MSSVPHSAPTPSPVRQRHGKARRLLRWLAYGLLALLVFALTLFSLGLWLYPALLAHFNLLKVEVQGLSLESGHLQVHRIEILRKQAEGEHLHLVADDLRLTWRWPEKLSPDKRFADKVWPPRQWSDLSWSDLNWPVLEELTLSKLRGRLDPSAVQAQLPWQQLLRRHPENWRLPAWIPQRIRIESAALALPCGTRLCELAGQARLDHDNGAARLTLKLLRGPHQMVLQAQSTAAPGDAAMRVDGLFNSEPFLTLKTQVETQQPGFDLTGPPPSAPSSPSSNPVNPLQWTGALRLEDLPPQAHWRDWLAEWLPALGEMPEARALDRLAGEGLAVQSRWDLTLPPAPEQATANDPMTIPLSGSVSLAATLPEATPVPWLGALGGELALSLDLASGAIERYQIEGDLQAPGLPWFATAAPQGLDTGPVRLRLTGNGHWPDERPSQLPVKLQLSSQGPLRADAEAQVQVRLTAPFGVDVISSDVRLQSTRVELGSEVRLLQAKARLLINGQAGENGYQFKFSPASWITAAELVHPEVSLEQVRATAEQFGVWGDQGHPHWQGTLALQTPKLTQEHLLPQGWTWRGSLDYLAGHLDLKGRARVASGIEIEHQLRRPAEGSLRLGWQAGELMLLKDNPLPLTFVAWPELLEVARGKLSAQGEVLVPVNEEAQLEVEFDLQGLTGLYNRLWLEGVSGPVRLTRRGGYVQLASAGLEIKTVDQGIVAGPVKVAGSYLAPATDLGDGMLDIDRLEAQLLGGRVWLEPVHLNLSQDGVVLPLLIRGVDLADVLALYRSEELSGEGTLDGLLPLNVSPLGVSVVNGRIQARPSGGLISYQPKRADGLARSDARMKLLLGVLDNFHYSVLAGDINYSETGQLRLGLEISGRNPAMAQSPPVNLNINLEEHLPMLMASLQLSENVSDKIKRRVSEALEQQTRKTE